MKTNNNLILTAAVLLALGAASAACGTKTESANITANGDKLPENARTEKTLTGKIAAAAARSASSPIEAYETAFAARQNDDVEGLKRILSKELLEFFTEIGKSDKKTLDHELRDLAETAQAETAESRNEIIKGDRATLEYLDEKGKWTPMAFVKEDGGWKLTLPESEGTITEDFN